MENKISTIEQDLYESLYRERALKGPYPLLDLNELRKLQNRIVIQVTHSGERSQSLEGIFPQTLQSLRGRFPERDFVREFMHSRDFDTYIELPFIREGISREEAFFNFLTKQIASDLSITLKQEFLFHLMRELAANPRPFFKVGCRDIRERKQGYVAILRSQNQAPYLYASLQGKFSHGAITLLLADLIECETLEKAQQCSKDPSHLAIILELQKRGMLD